MFQSVLLEPVLLEIVNTNTWFDDNSDLWFKNVVLVGAVSFLGLGAAFLYRLFHAADVADEWDKMRQDIVRVFQSTLLTRLCLLCACIVIPLVFYVNTKEHYWTAKHTSMLFTGFFGLFTWLAVCHRVPRFKIPYAWPVALILLTASLSTFRAVNMAESIGYLFAIFGSAVFLFLASQTFMTTKRIHLFVVTLITVALAMSIYGLCQAYLLLPIDYVYAQDTRAPVSTIGNKNYAAYFLDLTMPLALALAATRRSPLQTLFALTVFFFCRWHFALCDTRGGTISMTLGILFAILIVAVYHGRRFRLLLYAVLLEPLLWAAMSAAQITYSSVQSWGAHLNRAEELRPAIAKALRAELPEELQNAVYELLYRTFLRGNETYLGLNTRTGGLVFGILAALVLFLLLLKLRKDWFAHLGAAMGLALLPFLFSIATMPADDTPQRAATKIVQALKNDDSIQHKEVMVELMGQYGVTMARAAQRYNEEILAMHQNVAAMASLSLFVVMAVFLLYRWYDRKEGWAPGLAATAAIGIWFFVFLGLCSGGPLGSRLAVFFQRLDNIWPVDMKPFHSHHPFVGLFFSVGAFVLFTVLSTGAVIAITQYIPAAFSRDRVRELRSQGIHAGKAAAVVLLLCLLLAGARHPRIKRVGGAFIATTLEKNPVQGAFAALHTFFNTQAKVEGQTSDGAIGFRLEIYQGCFRKIKDSYNALLGIGPGNFKVVHPHPKFETALERRILGKEVLGRKAHNDFLEDAVENGLIGLLGIIWMFTTAGALLFLLLKRIHPPRDATDVFTNTISWGFAFAIVAILLHAQFEAPLLQPASTYPCWMMFGVIFQLYRVQHRRALLGITAPNASGEPSRDAGLFAEKILSDQGAPSDIPAREQIAAPDPPAPLRNPAYLWVGWGTAAILVTLITGSVLLRQFVGEMWLRWGMIFSESGVEQYDYVFQCMEKAQDIYPQQMETNYIMGRYSIDATSKMFPVWRRKNSPRPLTDAIRKRVDDQARQLQENYQLDVDEILEVAQLGIDVHKRDIFMNPNYKWAHNNMGVLCDKMAQIQETLAQTQTDPEKKTEHLAKAVEFDDESKNCYRIALEIDELQVYALFNLGVGAFRELDLDRAKSFFKKTMVADPGRGDVNIFVAKCEIGLENYGEAVDALGEALRWETQHKRNKILAEEKAEVEDILLGISHQNVTAGLADEEVAMRAARLLVEYFDRCDYLPVLAHATVNAGSPEQALQLAREADQDCERKALSAESIYAQAKAHALLGDATSALRSFLTVITSNAGATFRPLAEKDPAFDLIREAPQYKAVMGVNSSTSSAEEAPEPLESKSGPPEIGKAPQPASAAVSLAATGSASVRGSESQ